ncbi:MAG: ribonuclease R, partial [Clostridia bacterium]|nr:ribonuclease R [Clostridia bacterium]
MEFKDRIIEILSNKNYSPLNDESILKVLKVERSDIGQFFADLDNMEAQGLIFKTRKNKYVLPNRINLVVGILKKNRKGFGFVISESDDKGDVYISSSEMNSAMHGDRVAVRLMFDEEGDKSREGEVVKVIKRNNYEVVGTFDRSDKFGFVIPDDPRVGHDIFIPQDQINGAVTGDKVVAKIKVWPQKQRNPEGEITEVLG